MLVMAIQQADLGVPRVAIIMRNMGQLPMLRQQFEYIAEQLGFTVVDRRYGSCRILNTTYEFVSSEQLLAGSNASIFTDHFTHAGATEAGGEMSTPSGGRRSW
jgi:hypothetical protein